MSLQWEKNFAASGGKHEYDTGRIAEAKREGRCTQCRSRPARPNRRECSPCSSRRAERDHLRRRYGIPLAVIRSTNLTPAPGRSNADS